MNSSEKFYINNHRLRLSHNNFLIFSFCRSSCFSFLKFTNDEIFEGYLSGHQSRNLNCGEAVVCFHLVLSLLDKNKDGPWLHEP